MKMNRYARKRKHKREMEKKFAQKYAYGRSGMYNVRILRDRLEREAQSEEYAWWRKKHPPRNNGWEYWRTYYMTGMRQYAKKYSDKKIRQKYRRMIRRLDPEDVTAPKGADYEKEYDYNWTIW